jgi:hypothetical protein
VESSILSTTARVSAYKKKDLAEFDTISSEFSFDFEIYGDIDDSESYISSDEFKYQGYSVKLGDEPLSNTTRRIYVYRVDTSGTEIKMVNDVGTLTPITGLLRFNPIPTDTISTIKIYCTPASNDVVAKRNNLLQIDSNKSIVSGDIDTISVGGAAGAIDYTTYNRHS